MGKIRSLFYDSKFDKPGKEEQFLLKRRMRLINKLFNIRGKKEWYVGFKVARWTKQLAEVDKKLGIKPSKNY